MDNRAESLWRGSALFCHVASRTGSAERMRSFPFRRLAGGEPRAQDLLPFRKRTGNMFVPKTGNRRREPHSNDALTGFAA